MTELAILKPPNIPENSDPADVAMFYPIKTDIYKPNGIINENILLWSIRMLIHDDLFKKIDAENDYLLTQLHVMNNENVQHIHMLIYSKRSVPNMISLLTQLNLIQSLLAR